MHFYDTILLFRQLRINKKTAEIRGFSGGATGTRTLDPMIKSHLLYQLSYSPRTGPGKQEFFNSFSIGRGKF